MLERERACDEEVVALAQAPRALYARALLSTTSLHRPVSATLRCVPVLLESGRYLERRLKSIANDGRPCVALSRKARFSLLAILLLAFPGFSLTAWSAAAPAPATTIEEEAGVEAVLKQGTEQPASPELLAKVLKANACWLKPSFKKLSYTLSMKRADRGDTRETKVDYTYPNHVILTVPGQGTENRPMDGWALSAALQGVTFWGPLHALESAPNTCVVSVVGEDVLAGKQVLVLHVQAKGAKRREESLRVEVGCGISKSWWGQFSYDVDVDQVWVDKATGVALREEGFLKGTHELTVEYGDWEELPAGATAPRHVVISTQVQGRPWVFDMTFATYGGKAWLLRSLTETNFFQTPPLIFTAEVSDVTVGP